MAKRDPRPSLLGRNDSKGAPQLRTSPLGSRASGSPRTILFLLVGPRGPRPTNSAHRPQRANGKLLSQRRQDPKPRKPRLPRLRPHAHPHGAHPLSKRPNRNKGRHRAVSNMESGFATRLDQAKYDDKGSLFGSEVLPNSLKRVANPLSIYSPRKPL